MKGQELTDALKASLAECEWKEFPSSTCVECGRVIPAGSVQKCPDTWGGYCSWRTPAALDKWIKEQIKSAKGGRA